MNSQNKLGFIRRFTWAALLAAVFAIGCEVIEVERETISTNPKPSAIVGGQEETGYPAVGALVMGFGGAYSMVCTATLIDPSWVLAAGHCVKMYGITIPASMIYFYIGNDATNPSDTEVYDIQAVYPHENFDSSLIVNDISLLKLAAPIDSSIATPIPANMASLGDDMEGKNAFYVGFGLTSSTATNSSGIKRSAYIQIFEIGEIEYTSRYQDTETGICSGDSGGPGIYEFDGGVEKVIGVNSTGIPTSTTDQCIGYYNDTRVDAYAAWIADKMGIEAPDCNADIGICYCDDACQTDGSCDNSVCGTETCGDTLMCIADCGYIKSCQSDCLVAALPEEFTKMSTLYTCITNNCANATTEAQYVECINTSCVNQVKDCCDVTMCDLLGGGCEAGAAACRPDPAYTGYGFTNCLGTDSAGYGEPCDVSATDPTSCPDGMTCRATDNGDKCHQLCRTADDCTLGGGECKMPAFPAPNSDVGYCADDFSAVDTDTDSDSDTDSDTDVDSDTDTDTDTGTGEEAEGGDSGDDSCGCSAVGSLPVFNSLLALVLG
jgi:hypothetical protein